MDQAHVTEARCDIIFIIALMKTKMDEGRERKKTCEADQQRLMHLDHSAVLPPRSFDQPCFCPTQASKKNKKKEGERLCRPFK